VAILTVPTEIDISSLASKFVFHIFPSLGRVILQSKSVTKSSRGKKNHSVHAIMCRYGRRYLEFHSVLTTVIKHVV
jgi:hypothetical protein